MHERHEWRGQGLRRRLHRVAVPEVRVPGARLFAGGHVLQVRQLVHRHHDRDQPLRAGPTARARCRSWSTSRSGSRARPGSPTSSCPPAPTSSAGTSASGPAPAATAADGFDQCNHRLIVLAEEVHRAAGRVQVRLPDLLAPGRAPRPGRASTPKGVHRPRLGQAHLPGERPAQAHLLGGVREEGLLHGAGATRQKADPGPAVVRRGPASETRPTRARALGHRRPQGSADHLGQDRVRVEQPHPVRGRRHRSTPSVRPWARSTSRVGRATAPRSSSASTRCSW